MKTLAIRLEDDLHAQLSVLAQLRQSTITDEIRLAIEEHLEASKSDPELKNRAQAVLDDIERDAKAREAAIATLFSPTAERTAGDDRSGRPEPADLFCVRHDYRALKPAANPPDRRIGASPPIGPQRSGRAARRACAVYGPSGRTIFFSPG